MVKPDPARDYYSDLGVDSTADAATIKKCYRALAQQVHPDKNPAPEATAMFQNISTAYEVLKDPATRRQYDERRSAMPTTSHSRYQSGGNQRGNPWSNVGSQYPAPPKPPTARTTRPPPPSAGAQRYKNFETPKQSANATAQEGADARRSTYEAWEHMRNNRAPPPPTPGRSEGSKFKPAPKAARPVYEEFRANYNSPGASPNRRAQSNSAFNRKGFVPTTPGGDESPAPKGAYFTSRKSSQAPPPPPRNPPAPENSIPIDPLRQFRNHPDVEFEPRQSTPYATHGGEKFDPLGATLDPNDGINRSKSTHEQRNKPQQMPRGGSDSNLNSPHYSQPFATQTPPKSSYSVPTQESDSSNSDSGPTMRTRAFANARGVRKQQGAKRPDASGPVPAMSQTANGTANGQQANGEPSMYDQFRVPSSQQRQKSGKRTSSDGVKLPTVSEHISPQDDYFVPPASSSSRPTDFDPFRNLYKSPFAVTTPPSGVPGNLYPLEEATRSVLDDMINKRGPGGSFDTSSPREKDNCSSQPNKDAWSAWREPSQDGSPSKKQRSMSQSTQKPFGFGASRRLWNSADEINPNANRVNGAFRFSIPVDGNTFQRNGSTSSENINMKFSSGDWTGKFEGSNYFQPEQKAANMNHNPRSRTQSGSGTRSRGRSPVKPRPMDPHYMQNHAEPEGTVESPGGTKFSQEEWAKTFKNPTFVAPPPASNPVPPRTTRSRPVRKQTGPAPTATVVDGSDNSSRQNPAFADPITSAATNSPDAMDIDTPPVMKPTIPRVVPQNVDTASNPTATTATAELNVEFEDLRVKDLISSLALPTPPTAPKIPSQSLEMEPYHQYMEAFGRYMTAWDLFDSRMLLHFVTRKNINKNVGEARWTDEKAFDAYRMGIGDDRAVMTHFNRAHEAHAKAVKDCAVVREKMREFGENPRKKAS